MRRFTDKQNKVFQMSWKKVISIKREVFPKRGPTYWTHWQWRLYR